VGTRVLRTLWSPLVSLNQERHTQRRKVANFIFILYINVLEAWGAPCRSCACCPGRFGPPIVPCAPPPGSLNALFVAALAAIRECPWRTHRQTDTTFARRRGDGRKKRLRPPSHMSLSLLLFCILIERLNWEVKPTCQNVITTFRQQYERRLNIHQ
jgi:hypothetical protein